MTATQYYVSLLMLLGIYISIYFEGSWKSWPSWTWVTKEEEDHTKAKGRVHASIPHKRI